MNRDDEIDIIDYLAVFYKRRKLIIGITTIVAVISVLYSLLATPIYMAETTILPPQQSGTSTASLLLSRLDPRAEGLMGGALGVYRPSDIYIGILKSRTLYDRIIDRFNLLEIYEQQYKQDARKRLSNTVSIQTRKEGIIGLTVEDKDPKMAADIANAFIDELKVLTQKFAVTEASRRRLFFEEQLKQTKQSLVEAEESMKEFQEKTGAVMIEEQTNALIDSIARLKANISAKEVELKVMRTYATEQNPDLQRIREELKGLREQLNYLESETEKGKQMSLPTTTIPSLGTDYIRKLRDLKYNETLFELMAKQYEAARLDESRDAALIQVLDKAIPPEKRIKPKRKQIVIVSTVASLVFSVFLAFLVEYFQAVKRNRTRKAG